jgi:putative tryptophan/tyrosine transport system substrate-binding protein
MLGWPINATAARLIAALLSATFYVASWPAIAAQQTTKTYHMGVLGIESNLSPVGIRIWDAFLSGMQERGYIEGKNMVFERRYSEGQSDRFPALAEELVRLNVDLIVVWTTSAALAAKAATCTIPILFTTANDPVGTGLAESLARPGGNVTGISSLAAELSGKRLELLKEVVPRLSHVAVLLNATNRTSALQLRQTEDAARLLRIAVRPYEIRTPDDVAARLAEIEAQRPNALIMFEDAAMNIRSKEVAEFALRARIPSCFGSREKVVAGGLMAYGPSYAEIFHQTAFYADKLLKGVKPQDIPFEQVSKFELVVNLKTAQTLGLEFPQSILVRADEVLE